MVLASLLSGLSLLPLREDLSPPVVWTIMFIIWHVFMNSEYISSAPYSSTPMNTTFLSWLINEVTINFRISRGGIFLLDRNTKGDELSYHITTKVEVNPRMLSILKNEKSIWIMNPGANFETSKVGTMGILFALFITHIGQGCYNSGRFYGRPSKSHFIAIHFSLVITTRPKHWWISWDRFCF